MSLHGRRAALLFALLGAVFVSASAGSGIAVAGAVIDEPAENTTETLSNTTENTTDTTNETVESVENTTNETVGSIVNTTNDTVDVVENTTNETAETLDNTTETVTNDSGTGDGNGLLKQVQSTLSDSIDSVTGREDGNQTTTDSSPNEPAGTTAANGSGEGSATGADSWPYGPFDAAGGDAGLAVGAVAVLGGAAFVVQRSVGVVATSPESVRSGLGAARASLDRWLPRVFGPFGYSRYDDSDPLEHETRESVYELVHDRPGTYPAELSERAEVPISTLRYHLRILEHEDLVETDTAYGRKRYFPTGEAAVASPPKASRAVLAELMAGPATVSELAERLDRDPSTVSHHLDRLAEDGLVSRERDGQSVENRLTSGGRRSLALTDGSDDSPGRQFADSDE